jgi:two-component system osmolarity sensor histidine kinase EnvZ
VVAKQVNGNNGLWISFEMDGDPYWFLTDMERFNPAGGKTWVIWLIVATCLSLTGAAVIARLVNRPLRALSYAASRVREGDFNASRLDESVHTSEIREVNIGFNRMAQRLSKLDQDRALMLAGISHDLRTPLARLRLEAELSVTDLDARAHMAADIAQLDAIIDKFLDYARPDKVQLLAVPLKDIVESCAYPFEDKPDARIKLKIEEGLLVMADHVELGRIMSNLLENARKYGKSADTGIAMIEVSAVARDKWVFIKVRDHGAGVAADQIGNLTKPFYRGEAARTEANGAGLGLAIVEKTIQRMGGAFALNNSTTGGLSANIKLKRSPEA